MEKRKRKVTIETTDDIVGEQFLVICDKVYDILEAVDKKHGLKNMILNVFVQKRVEEGIEKTRKEVNLSIHYNHPFAKEQELSIGMYWRNEDAMCLTMSERTAIGPGDHYVKIYLPLQPSKLITFEELFARAIVRGIEYCFDSLKEKEEKMVSSLEAQHQCLKGITKDYSIHVSNVIWNV